MRTTWHTVLLILISISIEPQIARAQLPGNETRPPSLAVGRCGDPIPKATQSDPSGQPESSEPKLTAVPSHDTGNALDSRSDVTAMNRDNLLVAICIAVGREAMANDLPAEFFTRLIWQESRFNPKARSHVGAEGIAQFMPGTAQWRGLANAYDPFQALRESARWLAELRKQFGNLGLAAAAYNAGPGRIQNWLSGRGPLPAETRHYVRIVTGHTAEEWSQQRIKDDDSRVLKIIPCTQIAKLIAPKGHRPRLTMQSVVSATPLASAVSVAPSPSAPWGLQLAGNWSETRVLNDYRKLQERFPAILGQRRPVVLRSTVVGRGAAPWYRVRVVESTEDRAKDLCNKLEAAGGKCLVLRN